MARFDFDVETPTETLTDTGIGFKFDVPIQVRPDDVGYVAGCPSLDVFSQGTTEEAAVENLNEALSLFMLSCFERGTLVQVLKDCGFEPVPGDAVPTESSLRVEIPLRQKGVTEAYTTQLA